MSEKLNKLTRTALVALVALPVAIGADTPRFSIAAPKPAQAVRGSQSQTDSFNNLDLSGSSSEAAALTNLRTIYKIDPLSAPALTRQFQLPKDTLHLTISSENPKIGAATPGVRSSETLGQFMATLDGQTWSPRTVGRGSLGIGRISGQTLYAQQFLGDSGSLHMLRTDLVSGASRTFDLAGFSDTDTISQMSELTYNATNNSHSQVISGFTQDGYAVVNYFPDWVETKRVILPGMRAVGLERFFKDSTPFVWFLANSARERKIYEIRDDKQFSRTIEPLRDQELDWPKSVQEPNLARLDDYHSFSAMAIDSAKNEVYLAAQRNLVYYNTSTKNLTRISFPFMEKRDLRNPETALWIMPLTDAVGQTGIWKLELVKRGDKVYPVIGATDKGGRISLFSIDQDTRTVQELSDRFKVVIPLALNS